MLKFYSISDIGNASVFGTINIKLIRLIDENHLIYYYFYRIQYILQVTDDVNPFSNEMNHRYRWKG